VEPLSVGDIKGVSPLWSFPLAEKNGSRIL